MTSKCTYQDYKVSLCDTLNGSLAPLANDRKPGLSLFVLTYLETNTTSVKAVVLRSGDHKKDGIILNFCPFCGEKIFESRKQ